MVQFRIVNSVPNAPKLKAHDPLPDAPPIQCKWCVWAVRERFPGLLQSISSCLVFVLHFPCFPFSNSHRDHEMTVNVPKCLNLSADAANMHACWVVLACSTLQYGAVNWNVAKLDLLVRHVFQLFVVIIVGLWIH